MLQLATDVLCTSGLPTFWVSTVWGTTIHILLAIWCMQFIPHFTSSSFYCVEASERGFSVVFKEVQDESWVQTVFGKYKWYIHVDTCLSQSSADQYRVCQEARTLWHDDDVVVVGGGVCVWGGVLGRAVRKKALRGLRCVVTLLSEQVGCVGCAETPMSVPSFTVWDALSAHLQH